MCHRRTVCRLNFLKTHPRALPKSLCFFLTPSPSLFMLSPSDQRLRILRSSSLGMTRSLPVGVAQKMWIGRFAKSAKAGVTDMLRVYLDANATIYFVEKVAPYYQGIRQRLTDAQGKPTVHCVINDLLLMEVRVKPLREQDQTTLASFDRYFAAFASQTAPMDKLLFELATQLRVSHGIKTPDALHLAAAIRAGCDQFWTNDTKLISAAESRIEVINIGKSHGTNS